MNTGAIPEITPAEFIARRDRGEKLTLLDVREEWELKVASVPGIVHIPMNDVPSRVSELDRETEIVVLLPIGKEKFGCREVFGSEGLSGQ